MKKIITVANNKGGVGKSTTALALGSAFMKKGFKVLFIDLDPQGNLSLCLNAKDEKITALDLFLEEDEKTPVQDVIKHTEQGDIIPSNLNLVSAEKLLTDTGKEYRLKEEISPVISKYDYIIIDTPPSLNILTVNALVCATDVVIPVQADVFSVQGIATFRTPLQSVKKYCNKNLKVNGIVLTRFNNRSTISREMEEQLEQVAKILNTRLFNTRIRECVAIKESQLLQKNLFEYAPKSNAVKDYSKLAEEVMEG